VLCSFFLSGRIQEPKFDLFAPIRRGYGVILGKCLQHLSFIAKPIRAFGIQFSVRNRDLAGAVEEAKRVGYTFDWGGEYKDYLAAREQLKIIAPLTVLLILLILFALYGNLKFPLIILFSVLVTEPVGGLLALWLTGTNFSVSSGLGFVALMGVAVLTSVILYSFINKLRLEGMDIPLRLHRYRKRFAEAIRDRDRGRARIPVAVVDLPVAGSLLGGGKREGRLEGLRPAIQ